MNEGVDALKIMREARVKKYDNKNEELPPKKPTKAKLIYVNEMVQ